MGIMQAVTTVFKSKDNTSKSFNTMSKNAKKFGETSSRAFNKASKSASNFGTITKGILTAGAVQKGLGAMTAGLSAASAEFVSFDDSITAAAARFKDVAAGTEQAAKVMQQLRKAARDAGKQTQFSAAAAAQGLDFFARAGFKSNEAMSVLTNQIDLATAVGEDFARVADISSDLLGALGLNADNSAKKIANLKRMNNFLAVATNSANVTMEDLFETLKIAGPIATAAGESTQKVIAMAAALGSAGIKGSMGATALKNAYIRLLDTTPKVEKALAGVGLSAASFIDQSGKMKSMTKIMETLGKSTKDLGKAEQLKFFSVIFGKQAVAGATNLSKSLSGVDKILKSMEDKDAMKKIADQMRTSLGPRLDILKSGLIELSFKVFTAFEKQGKTALDTITKAVQNFDVQPIIDGIQTAINVIKTITSILAPFTGAIKVAIGAWAAYAIVTKSAAIAQGALNLVMSASPIGLIITGVTALAAVGVTLYQNWDKVVETFKNVTGWFSALLDNPFIAGAAVLFAWPIAIPALIIKHWTPIVAFFAGIFDAISDTVKIAGRFIGFDMGETTGEIEQGKTNRRGAELAAAARMAPNKVQVDSRQSVDVSGNINIAGAPEGSTATSISAPGIEMNMMALPATF